MSATRAPPRARTMAATLPAGPDPTTATSKCSSTTETSDIDGAFCGIVAPCAPTTPSTGARNSRFARRLFTGLPERYDRLAEVLSLGQNGRWRRAMVDHVVEGSPRLILDVATGPAGVALQLASRTGGQVVGVDLTEAMIREGKANVARAGAQKQVQVVLGKGEQLPFPDATFDALTFTYLLRYVEDPAATLRELARVVRPGGTVANLEFLVPAEPVLAVLVVGLHPARPARRPVPSRAGGSGSPWVGSSGPTSRPTTAASRCRGRSRPGVTPGSTTSGCGP